ncbi:MAG: magnesium transporter [Gallionellaceae bacterium]|jgi:magnesium transporter
MPDTVKKKCTDLALLVEQAMDGASTDQLVQACELLHPAEIADIIESLPYEQRLFVWHFLDADTKGDVLVETDGEVRQQLISETSSKELVMAVERLDMDALADLDAHLPSEVVVAVLQAMDAQRRRRFDAVRSYADDTAGGLMDADAIAVRGDVTLDVVLRYVRQLRRQQGSVPEHIDTLMVVNNDNLYLGMLYLGDLVSLDPRSKVAEVMNNEYPPIPADMSARKVAREFENFDLISAAVVDDAGHLIGRITVDDVLDVIREEGDRSVRHMGGVHEETDIFSPALSSARHRSVWLGVNLINGFVAAWVIGMFGESIEKMVALAILMPVVAGMGGVAGTQTMTIVTRGLALEQVVRGNALRLLYKELTVGIMNGLLWGALVATVAVFWFDNTTLGLVFASALFINLFVGALAGTLFPLLLHKLGIDPALAGGVLLIAATDVLGFTVFLGLATLILL